MRRLGRTLRTAMNDPNLYPCYRGHMMSDLLLPGLIAQILTLPYNPNNISEEAAPVTVDLEMQVGLQLAKLIPRGI